MHLLSLYIHQIHKYIYIDVHIYTRTFIEFIFVQLDSAFVGTKVKK